MEIEGKVFLITGASSGIGAALARDLLARGATVVLAARRAKRLDSLLSTANAGDRGLAVATDVTDRAQLDRLVSAAVGRFGGIDVLVNNAGWGLVLPMNELTPDEYEYGVRVNLLGPILLTQMALPYLRSAAPSSVVNVSSMAARVPLPLQTMYVATKAGLAGFGHSLRRELSGTGVHVMNVYPGMIDTEIIEGLDTTALGPGVRVHPAEFAAREIVRGIERDTAELIVGGLGERVANWAQMFAPCLVDRAARRVRDAMYDGSTVANRNARDRMSRSDQPDRNPPSTGNT